MAKIVILGGDRQPVPAAMRAKLFTAALIVLPVAVMLSQLALTSQSNLTRWKGGGFAMYTDSHPSGRALWVKTSNRWKKVFPLSVESFEKMPRNLRKSYNMGYREMKFILNFPDAYADQACKVDYLLQQSENTCPEKVKVTAMHLNLPDRSLIIDVIYEK